MYIPLFLLDMSITYDQTFTTTNPYYRAFAFLISTCLFSYKTFTSSPSLPSDLGRSLRAARKQHGGFSGGVILQLDVLLGTPITGFIEHGVG